MKVIPLERVDLTLPEAADLAQGERIILTRKGKPWATLNNLSGTDWESVSLANNPQFMALIEKSRRAYREEGGTELQQLCRELGLKTRARPQRQKKRR